MKKTGKIRSSNSKVKTKTTPAKSPKKKVLVLGVDIERLKSIRNFLEEKKFEATCTVDLQMGKDMVSQENFGYILADYQIIKKDYHHWIEEAKNRSENPAQLKFMVFLGRSERVHKKKLLAAGTDQCLIDTGDEKLFAKEIYKFIAEPKRKTGKDTLTIGDLKKETDGGRERQQELMDEVARMSSKLEESLIRETNLRRELEAANKTKDELLSFAAHDLRSPLATIISTVTFICDPKMDIGPLNSVQKRFLTRIKKQIKQLIALVDETLDFTKLQSGFVDLHLSSVNLSSLIKEKCSYYSIAAKKKSISLTHKIEGTLPAISADENKLSSVLDNLIGNAIKYSSAGDAVIVRGKMEKNEVFVEIEDTGQGLHEDELNKAFDAYQKLSARPTGGESSSGLGLAIVKKIVAAHGGRVGIKTELGKGSVFYFAFKRERFKIK